MARGSAGQSALQRHLRVLSAFETRHPFLTLSEISERSGLAPSTVHRLLAELLQEGLVERAEDRVYRLGVRLYEFASRTPGGLGLREISRPYLARVHSVVRQHAQIGVLAGTDVLTIEKLSARDAVVNGSYIGGRTALALSGPGLVLLAHAPESLVAAVVAEGLPRSAAHPIHDAAELQHWLRRARKEGAVVADGWIYAESRSIAVPIYGPARVVTGALCAIVPNDATPTRPTIELLQQASTAITRELELAYAPHGDEGPGLRPLVASSTRSLEWLEAQPEG